MQHETFNLSDKLSDLLLKTQLLQGIFPSIVSGDRFYGVAAVQATDCSHSVSFTHSHPEFWILLGAFLLTTLSIILWRHSASKQLKRLQNAQAALQDSNAELSQEIYRRQQIEQKLRESEAKLAEAQQVAHIGSWDFDLKTEKIVWSEEMFLLFGFDPTQPEPTYAELVQSIHPEDRAQWQQAVEESLRTGKPYIVDHRVVLPDGSFRYIEGRGKAEIDQQGQVVRLFGTGMDITVRKQAEIALQQLNQELEMRVQARTSALQKSEERFRQLAENITQVFWLLDLRQMQVLYASPAYEQIWGRTVDSLYKSAMSWIEAIHPDDRQQILLNLPQRYATGFDQEYRIIQPSGEVRWIRDRAFPIVNEMGQVNRIAGLAEDITERKRIEESLRQKTEVLQTIFDNIPVMLTSYDGSGRITLANRAFENILGWTTAELPYIDLIEVCYPDAAEYERVVEWMREPRPGWCDFRTTVRDGRVIDTSWANVQLSDGTRIGIGQDISERKRTEQEIQTLYEVLAQQNRNLENLVDQRTAELLAQTRQLEATNRELESFSYSVSHDLRAPSRHIHGFVNVLRQYLEQHGLDGAEITHAHPPIDPKITHYLDVIESSSRKMGLLIDGLLTLSRVGRRQMEFRSVALRPLVEEAIASAQIDHAGNRPVEFRIGDLPTVEGDAVLLQQVLFNLISNAIKFSRDVDAPCIEIGSLPNQTVFIRDNGIGFLMEDAEHIFDAFQRLHGREFEGTGIGLAIVQRIIHRHNGMIWVESQPNQGATFYFQLGQ